MRDEGVEAPTPKVEVRDEVVAPKVEVRDVKVEAPTHAQVAPKVEAMVPIVAPAVAPSQVPIRRPRRGRQPVAYWDGIHDQYHRYGRMLKYSGDARFWSTFPPSHKEYRPLPSPPPPRLAVSSIRRPHRAAGVGGRAGVLYVFDMESGLLEGDVCEGDVGDD